jgi:hypothetical protein
MPDSVPYGAPRSGMLPDKVETRDLEIEMLKNRFLTAFAFAGLIGFAACAAEDENVEFDDGSTLEEPGAAAPITPSPVTVDSMTMPSTTDTTGMDTAATDSITM